MTDNKTSIPFKRHAIVLALALASGGANAAAISVSGTCDLITAINNANTDSITDVNQTCVAGSGADTITLPSNSITTLTATNNNTNGQNGLPVIKSVITINGNNPTIERSTLAGTPNFRIFLVSSAGNLTLNNITVTGGKVGTTGSAGGIRNQGFLTLINSKITGNKGGLKGGGILNVKGASVTLNNSSISENSAESGGGISNLGGITIVSSTLFNNSSTLNGGAINNTGTLKITNGTLSGNKGYAGGAIYNHGSLTLNSVTISSNSIVGTPGVGIGAGLNNEASLDIQNTIIGGSTNGSDCGGSGTFSVSNVNLIEDGSCGASLSGTSNLFALLNNGGDTLTHALKTTSIAINTLSNGSCTALDQRGIDRPQPVGGSCDIGSYELISTTPTSVTGIISFFDAAVSGGTLVSATAGSSYRTALRNQLLTAGSLQDDGQTSKACDQLTQTLPYIDPDSSIEPDDYVTGTAGANLVSEIGALSTSWSCPL